MQTCYSLLAPLVGLEPTTYRLTAERSTNWANGEYLKLATTYFLSRVTRKYLRHIRAWLLCSVWEQVFPLCYHHQKSFVYFPLIIFYIILFSNDVFNISLFLLFVNILLTFFWKLFKVHSKLHREKFMQTPLPFIFT